MNQKNIDESTERRLIVLIKFVVEYERKASNFECTLLWDQEHYDLMKKYDEVE